LNNININIINNINFVDIELSIIQLI